MGMTSALPQRYALILDRDAIKAAIEHAARSALKGRICRPLDRPNAADVSLELRNFDHEVDLDPGATADGLENEEQGENLEGHFAEDLGI